MQDKIIIRGAKEHNLKNINLEIPRNKFVVFTGLSGSGKSSLAYDTIFAEGQRRYLESLSSYARQFLGQMDKPDVEYIEGLSPSISVDQKSITHNPRSTVGTVTEIHDYLRLLFARIGKIHCPKCDKEIVKMTVDEIVEKVFEIENGRKIRITSPTVRGKKGEYINFLNEIFKRGFFYVFVDSKKVKLSSESVKKINLNRYKKHDIDILIDEVEVNEENLERIFEDMEKALNLSEGIVEIELISKNKNEKINKKKNKLTFNQDFSCSDHPEVQFPEMEPRLFSFNSPYGACAACEGLGVKKEIDPDLVVPDKNKTIAEGGIMPWSYKRNNWQGNILRSVTNYFHIPDNVRLRDLSKEQINILLFGDSDAKDMISKDKAENILVTLRSKKGSVWKYNLVWRGVLGHLEDRYFKTDSEAVRADIEKYMSKNACSVCLGTRFRKEVVSITVGGKNISQISDLSIDDSLNFFQKLNLNKKEKIIAEKIIVEIKKRLNFLSSVGLGYLTLSRSANTLAGGETQRIRLASQVGSGLTGVLYILDEPSIGLHARDNSKLLETLAHLRNLGNTLIVIEHDEETMKKADFLVDVGPGAGNLGGKIVASGKAEEIMENSKSLTGQYLSGQKNIEIPKNRRGIKNKKWLVVQGARENNLKNITVEIPLKVFACVTGVSGSGKSTLVEEILFKSLSSKIMRSLEKPGKHKEILGAQYVDKIIMIDQSPIGRTPRSNPATYTGLFSPIRNLFAATKFAKARGYSPGRFSFNVSGGRCENCKGDGQLKIEMQFMPDVYLPCDVCKGKRYNSETLKVKYKDKNIAQILDMTVKEAKEFFKNFPEIYSKLKVLDEVGLGYIRLGQNATTLSGGEAQRIKLATELAKKQTGNTLYILDEPTTGLHFEDIKKLLGVLNSLVDQGNSVVVIEHNLDVLKSADWIIDLGPEGGDDGGKIIASGTPEEISKNHDRSYTGKYLKKILRK